MCDTGVLWFTHSRANFKRLVRGKVIFCLAMLNIWRFNSRVEPKAQEGTPTRAPHDSRGRRFALGYCGHDIVFGRSLLPNGLTATSNRNRLREWFAGCVSARNRTRMRAFIRRCEYSAGNSCQSKWMFRCRGGLHCWRCRRWGRRLHSRLRLLGLGLKNRTPRNCGALAPVVIAEAMMIATGVRVTVGTDKVLQRSFW